MSFAVAAVLLPGAWAQGQGQQQWPSWLPDQAKDAMNELQAAQISDGMFADEPCRMRLDALKKLSMVGQPEASQLRATILQQIGFCDLRGADANHAAALRRFESALSELNAPNEEMLMQNLDMAPMVLMKQAAKALRDHKVGEAGVALRRSRTIYSRQWDKVLKQVMKQNNIPEAGLPQVMPKLMKEPFAVSILGFQSAIDEKLGQIDQHLTRDKANKDKKGRLAGSAGGSLAYLSALPMESTTDASRLLWVETIVDQVSALAKEASDAELAKHTTLLKRTKKGSGCEKLPKICEALQGIPDIASNGFGESRLLVLKKGKKQKLELCETNGNVAVMVALNGAVELSVGSEKSLTVEEAAAVAYDFCLESSVTAAADGTLVLFLQAWHPEVAALERTTHIREKATSSWSLDETTVKSLTKVVNDAAKKTWDTTVKKWREGSKLATDLEEYLNGVQQKQREEKDVAEEEKRKAEETGDEEKQRVREEMEQKRQEQKRKVQEKVEAKRKQVEEVRKKELEAEPWRLDYRVIEAKAHFETVKEERRDANAKMEFDESARLTKEASKAERKLESVMEKAKKYLKKHGVPKTEKGGQEDGAHPEAGSKTEDAKDSAAKPGLAGLKKALQDLETKKKDAAAKEEYKEASRLKKEIDELKLKIEKLEL